MSARQPIRKAVFPVAGLGTRFLPATKAIPKEMLPIVDVPTMLIFAATLACLIWVKRIPEPVLIALVGIASILFRAA